MEATGDNNQEELKRRHLGWTDKQKRILTGGERAEELYTAARGFPFQPTELPHYHLSQGDTHNVFKDWKTNPLVLLTEEGEANNQGAGSKRSREDDEEIVPIAPVAGAWTRLVFFGGFEHTSIKDERTYNLQTNNLFIDLRIPRTREALLPSNSIGGSCLPYLNGEQLRCYARQHVFAGYTRMAKVSSPKKKRQEDLLCTRHHCIDWNFVGAPRSRPNKWWVEMQTPPSNGGGTVQTWKEWAFATDERGQQYYCEQWERLPGGEALPMLALRRRRKQPEDERDAILLIVGDHFSYIFGRDLSTVSEEKQTEYTRKHSSLVGIVDAALDQEDSNTARAYLSMQAGHGLISKGWIIDCAIEPWREGSAFWKSKDNIIVKGEDPQKDCTVQWNDDIWEVFDTSLASVKEVQDLLDTKRKDVSRL